MWQCVNGRASDRVYEVLRQRIITGVMRPGEVINESEIMGELAVGRTPVREAVLLLIKDELVKAFHRRGTFVSEITVDSMQRALEIRPGFEALAIRMGVERASDGDLQQLAARTGADRPLDTPNHVLEYDFEVHSAIVGLSRNEYLIDAWTRVYTACTRLKYASLSPIQDAQTVRGELNEIVSYVAARNAGGAIDAMQRHLMSFRVSVGGLGTQDLIQS